MRFEDIKGQKEVKERLIQIAMEKKVPHALMFMGKRGAPTLPMALAFANFLQCENPSNEGACGTCISCRQTLKYQHPDVHFMFPYIKLSKAKTFESINTTNFLKEWRLFLEKTPYGQEKEWRAQLEEDKIPLIPVHESRRILKQLSLKAFGKKYKILICWMTEKMNVNAANAMLKLIEEPTPYTIMIFCTEHPERILQTIQSRTQKVLVPQFTDDEIKAYLEEQHAYLSDSDIHNYTMLAEGDLQKAFNFAEHMDSEADMLDMFRNFMRMCYMADFDKIYIWGDEFTSITRQKQDVFFTYGLNLMRSVLNALTGTEERARFKDEKEQKFVEGFSKIVDVEKLVKISRLLEEYRFYIQRNASAKIQMVDLSIEIKKVFSLG